MRNKKSIFCRPASALLALLLITACGDRNQTAKTSVEKSEVTAEKHLRIGIGQFPGTRPLGYAGYISGFILRGMTTFDDKGKVFCTLCTTLPSFENGLAVLNQKANGETGISQTFHIHPEARWGDGSHITSEDFKLRWEVGRDKSTGHRAHGYYMHFSRFEIVDDKTFVLHSGEDGYHYQDHRPLKPLNARLERAIFERDPKAYLDNSYYSAEPANPALWNGPYLVAKMTLGDELVMERNPYWYGKRPYFDKITIRAIENSAALEANLVSGTIDMIAGGAGGLQTDQAISFEKRHGEKFNIFYAHGVLLERLLVNMDNPILSDKRVRKALLYALDRQQISEQLFDGKQPVGHERYIRYNKPVPEGVHKYDYDKSRAIALLEEAGWAEIRNGIRYNNKGEPLKLELGGASGDKTRDLIRQAIQSYWRDVGVDLRLTTQTQRVFFGQTVRKRKFPGLALGAVGYSPHHLYKHRYHSASIPSDENGFSGMNHGGFHNAQVDELVIAHLLELDAEKYHQMTRTIQSILTDELPDIPLFWRPKIHVLPLGLKGFRASGHITPCSVWVEDWRFE
ncbi:peptide ABC transporter substrate-binding protein [Porticoccus sp. W117]|uniref:peptide ABC transporter substrate-binding protein n=1 Tax=Porticoccus sp. W117 TaxID=3054777 RepID=UPI00259AD6FF|nr:peptide ABC transporter substrate-binding protein [Porticoccus sp. W117]MDM3871041.1 peptide ABC transporter substrate-binding protein [Porticoccus sp. W117]